MLFLQKTGLPTYFITFTANPTDPDVLKAEGYDRNDGSNNYDIVCRVFAAKVEKLKELLKKGKVLGNVLNLISVTEFQKRGLPHIHMVLTCDHSVSYTLR